MTAAVAGAESVVARSEMATTAIDGPSAASHVIPERLWMLLNAVSRGLDSLWARLGKPYSIHQQPLPTASSELMEVPTVPVVVQVNGRTRGLVQLAPSASEADALRAAREVDAARDILDGAALERVIYVPRRIVNLVTTRA